MIETCVDFVTAATLPELVDKMNALQGDKAVELDLVRDAVERYDATIARGASLMNDEQLRRIAALRQYRGDRIRLCKFQPINDARALPLIAVREFIISRKSLGGIQTDLQSRVLDAERPADRGALRGRRGRRLRRRRRARAARAGGHLPRRLHPVGADRRGFHRRQAALHQTSSHKA